MMHVSCAIWPACLPALRCSEINRGGLLLIYKILVDTAQADIAKSLQVGGGRVCAVGWAGVAWHGTGVVWGVRGLLV